MRAQLARDRFSLLFDLPLVVLVALGELRELDQVAGAPLEALPRGDELAVLGRLTRLLSGAAWVVPRARLRQLGV